jgi:hypothetical protein
MKRLDENGNVIITQAQYDELMDDREFLQCLFAVGVDSWDGFETAQEMMDE